MDNILFQAMVYLAVGVIAVPISKRLGLGSVLGYLAAGMIVGRFLPLGEHSELQQVAEFGVVMMLFVIGLEVEPRKLWEMRKRLIGLGGLQMVVTTGAFTGVAMLLGRPWEEALAIGAILSLSSTAIVLQTLNEKGWMQTEGGRSSFSVLLFQDIAVIPIIAILPLLGVAHGLAAGTPPVDAAGLEAGAEGANGIVAALPAWLQGVIIVGAIAGVIFFGRYLTRPAFRFIASSRLSEVFTAAALLLVVAIAALMTFVGLSPALGAFVAGVVLADSEFRHELESDIAPFRGLLLGLFFITVGAGINFALLMDEPAQILLLAILLILIKAVILLALGRLFKLVPRDRLMMALGLAQTGEFGFVLLNLAVGDSVLPADVADKTSLVVAISMLLTPLLFLAFERWLSPLALKLAPQRADDAIDIEGPAIIAGIGRFGQIVNRLLVSQGFRTVVIDHEEEMVETLARFEQKAFYGDASRPAMLEAAGIEHAKLFVIAIDDRERAIRAAEWVKRHHPQVKILARAFDRMHYYELREVGADIIIREMFGSSLQAAGLALRALGVNDAVAARSIQIFKQHDEETLEELYQHWEKGTDVTMNPVYVEANKARVRMFNDALHLDREAFEDDGDPANVIAEKQAPARA